MSLENKPLPRVRPDVAWTAVGDGAVLYCTTRELYYGVNEVAAFVWEQLPTEGTSLDALCSAVGDRYPDADPAQVRADVIELLDDLARCGLLASAEG